MDKSMELQVEPLNPQSVDYKLSSQNVVYEGGEDPEYYGSRTLLRRLREPEPSPAPEPPFVPVDPRTLMPAGAPDWWRNAPRSLTNSQVDVGGGSGMAALNGSFAPAAQALTDSFREMYDRTYSGNSGVPQPSSPQTFQPGQGAQSLPTNPMVRLLRAEGGKTVAGESTPLAQALRGA